MPPTDPLDLSTDERRRLGERALALVLDYFDRMADLEIHPRVSADDLDARLRERVPAAPTGGDDVLRDYVERIAPYGRANGHPRMFGYVSSSAAFMGVLADFLASALNQNVTSWRSAPGPTAVERLVVDWFREMLGYAPGASGLLLSGGSTANFAALAAALHAKAGVDLRDRGVRALTREPVIYASSMAHMSIVKAAEMLGLGRSAVRTIDVRPDFTLDLDLLAAAIDEDRRADRQPMAVVANAGEVNTGAVDPLGAILDVCHAQGLWCHVDAAYGGFAALAPRARARFDRIAEADSVTLDPHKWLFAPLDAGCLLVGDAGALMRVFSHGASYLNVLGSLSDFAFWDVGPELSRRFRALKLWMTIKRHGTEALGAAIDENIRLAGRLGEMIQSADDFELLAPIPLSIVCFRYVPPLLRDDDARLNALNKAITIAVQQGGHDAYFSNALLNGRFGLRACLVNYRTTEDDLRRLLATIRRAAASVGQT